MLRSACARICEAVGASAYTVGNHVVFSNNALLAGHCTVGDYVILGGGAAVIQFARVGAHSFIGGMSGLENDLIPFGMALGNRANLSGLNIIGLKRRGLGCRRLLWLPMATLTRTRLPIVSTDWPILSKPCRALSSRMKVARFIPIGLLCAENIWSPRHPKAARRSVPAKSVRCRCHLEFGPPLGAVSLPHGRWSGCR